MNSQLQEFYLNRTNQVESNSKNESLRKAASEFNTESNKAFYSYNFSWMGRPIIVYQQIMITMHEMI